MHAMTDHPHGRPNHRLLRLAVIVVCAAIGLGLGIGVRAETPQGRRPGEPLVEAMTMSRADRVETRARVGEIVRGLGIRGKREPTAYHARSARRRRDGGQRPPAERWRHRADGSTGALGVVARLDRRCRRPGDRAGAAPGRRRQGRLAAEGGPGVRGTNAMVPGGSSGS
jgi:hypothetical protein